MQGFVGVILPAFSSLTHLLIKLAPISHQSGLAAERDWVYSFPAKARTVLDTIQEYFHILSSTSTSLRWIGYDVHEWGVKSWDITRSSSGSGETACPSEGVKMIEKTESASLAVLKGEGMDEFKDVVPNLVIF